MVGASGFVRERATPSRKLLKINALAELTELLKTEETF